MSRRRFNSAYLLTLPALAGSALFMIYPILFAVWLSFHRWDMLSDTRRFVGAANYVRVFSSASFLQVLSNSCVYMALMTTLSMALALLLALWLNENSIIKNLAQSAIFTPHIVCCEEGPFVNKLRALGFQPEIIPFGKAKLRYFTVSIPAILKFSRLLKRLGIRVVHVSGLQDAKLAVYAAAWAKVPVAWVVAP